MRIYDNSNNNNNNDNDNKDNNNNNNNSFICVAQLTILTYYSEIYNVHYKSKDKVG
jgi:hypothetical protein